MPCCAGSIFRVLQADIPVGVGHAGQYTAFGFFFCGQTGPVNLVVHAARSDVPQTGAACAVAAGAGPLQAAHLDGVEQGVGCPCIALLAAWFEFDGK